MLPDRPAMTRRAEVPQCGTPSGFTSHMKAGTPPCEPCRTAKNRYQAAWQIRCGRKKTVLVPVLVLKELLAGADIVEVLERERGTDIVEAIRSRTSTATDVAADDEHSAPAGAHHVNGNGGCSACAESRAAEAILLGTTTALRVPVSALGELLNGANAATVLERDRGAEVVAAIRQSGGAS